MDIFCGHCFSLQEDKKLMQREYDRMPKKGEVEKKIKELQAACDDLRREITQRQAEAKNLKEDLDTKKKEIASDKKMFEESNEEKERLKASSSQILFGWAVSQFPRKSISSVF